MPETGETETRTDPVFEYARLFGEIAAWVREGGERGGPFSGTYRRDADGLTVTCDYLAGVSGSRFSALTWKPIANLSSVVAYLRPDALVSRGNPTHGHMCRCDLRGGGRREWPADEYVPTLKALRDRISAADESRPKDGPTPGDWKDRLLAESTELAARLARLTAFVRGGGPAFAALPETDRALLIRQREAMLEYSRILGERIGRAGWEAKGS